MNKPLTSRSRKAPSRRSFSGFTLTEVLVTLAVLATLATLGGAAWKSVMTSMKLTALSNTFHSQLMLARSEAINRNMRVALCKSPDGIVCVTTGSWEQGWIVFHDINNTGKRETGETVVYRVDALPAGYRLLGNTNVSKYVSFGSNGGAITTGGGFQAGTLTLCQAAVTGGEAREIIINSAGRPRIRKTTATECA